jgi:hypothetical protein
MVKKSKHFFATSYPDLSTGQLAQLIKLAHEAKTVIKIANPYYYKPAVQWLSVNLKKPAYVTVSCFNNEPDDASVLLKLLLMLTDLISTIPKKTSAVLFRSEPANSLFHNVLLEFADGSVVNLNFGKKDTLQQFNMNVYMHNTFAELDLIQEKYLVNNNPVDPSELFIEDETESFLNSVLKKSKVATDIETYSNTLQIMRTIQEKLDRYDSF